MGRGIRVCCFDGFVDFDDGEEETPATDAEHEAAATPEDPYGGSLVYDFLISMALKNHNFDFNWPSSGLIYLLDRQLK